MFWMREREVRVDKTVLKNGIRVLSTKMPHTSSVSMSERGDVGARDETER